MFLERDRARRLMRERRILERKSHERLEQTVGLRLQSHVRVQIDVKIVGTTDPAEATCLAVEPNFLAELLSMRSHEHVDGRGRSAGGRQPLQLVKVLVVRNRRQYADRRGPLDGCRRTPSVRRAVVGIGEIHAAGEIFELLGTAARPPEIATGWPQYTRNSG